MGRTPARLSGHRGAAELAGLRPISLGRFAPQLLHRGDGLEEGSGAAPHKAAAVRALRSCLSPESGMCQAQGLSHLVSQMRAEGVAGEAAICFPAEGEGGDPHGLMGLPELR